MVIFAPGTIALIKRVQTNRQDASSEIDLRRTGFLWSKGVLMLQKEPDTSNLLSRTPSPCSSVMILLAWSLRRSRLDMIKSSDGRLQGSRQVFPVHSLFVK